MLYTNQRILLDLNAVHSENLFVKGTRTPLSKMCPDLCSGSCNVAPNNVQHQKSSVSSAVVISEACTPPLVAMPSIHNTTKKKKVAQHESPFTAFSYTVNPHEPTLIPLYTFFGFCCGFLQTFLQTGFLQTQATM